jgi:hypothetical protein
MFEVIPSDGFCLPVRWSQISKSRPLPLASECCSDKVIDCQNCLAESPVADHDSESVGVELFMDCKL